MPWSKFDFSSAYDCSQVPDDKKKLINLVASGGCCGGNSGAPKSTCPPRDYSHVCKVPANYIGDYAITSAPNSITCDAYISMLSVASGYQNDANKAGPLHGLDFSQKYDCSSSSVAIKEAINIIANKDALVSGGGAIAGAGCCGGNSGAPKSTCWTPPRKFFFCLNIHM